MITSPDIQDENHTRRIIEYNADNMPVRITKGSDVSVVYTYDGHGTRVAKTLNCATTAHYVGSHYETKNGAPVHYIFAGNLRIAMIKNNVRTYFHKDHLGSSTVLTNDAGEVISAQSMVYMPYGSVRSQTDITESAYKFTDQENESETGLYNYNARLYDPVIGMFVSADTIVPDPLNPQTFNRYAYCGNNPILYVDPDGHFFGIDDLIIGIVVGALIGGTSAELQGGDFWDGAISGAISGAIFSGIHFIPGMTNISAGGTIYVQGGGTALSSGAQAAIHFAGGALSGGINAAIKGGDISTGMLIGGIGAGIGKYVGVECLKGTDWGTDLATRTAISGVIGGIAAEIYGGNFSDGFINGARSAVIAYLCNDMLESLAKLSHNDCPGVGPPVVQGSDRRNGLE